MTRSMERSAKQGLDADVALVGHGPMMVPAAGAPRRRRSAAGAVLTAQDGKGVLDELAVLDDREQVAGGPGGR